MKSLAAWFVRLTQSLVWRIAHAYGLKVERELHGYGQHPLSIEDLPEIARHNIPRSVFFNTRSGAIFVGADTVFGEGVMVLTGKHANIREVREQRVPLHHVPESGRDIRIGRGCYIGSGAILIGPITIGDNAVIGAGSVVTHDVTTGTFVAGVPARLVANLGGGGAS
jgi:acetyltransferase-like isoleucine patch superfamily enzyme